MDAAAVAAATAGLAATRELCILEPPCACEGGVAGRGVRGVPTTVEAGGLVAAGTACVRPGVTGSGGLAGRGVGERDALESIRRAGDSKPAGTGLRRPDALRDCRGLDAGLTGRPGDNGAAAASSSTSAAVAGSVGAVPLPVMRAALGVDGRPALRLPLPRRVRPAAEPDVARVAEVGVDAAARLKAAPPAVAAAAVTDEALGDGPGLLLPAAVAGWDAGEAPPRRSRRRTVALSAAGTASTLARSASPRVAECCLRAL